MEDKLHRILKEVFGFDAFRPIQKEIVEAVYQGRDTVALLPTGGGKSLCFQVPALAKEGICLVVSPLIALMKDQVDQLKTRGVKAVAIHSGLSTKEVDTLLSNCIFGEVKFLYLSPERLKTPIFVERFKQMKVNLIAVDEAHCISQWGYDFRPSYLEIAQIRSFHPKVPVVALTASATPEVVADIQEKLLLKHPALFQQSFFRKNLSYSVRLVENKLEKGIEILQRIPGSAIWYVRTRQGVQKIAKALVQMGIAAESYHAGMSGLERSAKQEAWKTNKIRVMVSTNAFGMGIDKPDVRAVIHSDLPEHMENYYQEAGRAGRDGLKAFAVLLTNAQDFELLMDKAALVYPPIDYLKRVYQCLANYFQLAVGTQPATSFDFDLHNFCSTYQLPSLETYYALKVLGEEGILSLNESFFTPSRVHFLVDPSRLYEIQIQNAALDPILKMLLRSYGGNLFSEYLPIQESKLAKVLGTTEAEVIRLLTLLAKMEVLDYDKRKDGPQLSFLTQRFDAALLPLQHKRIHARRELSLEKAKRMVAYAHQQEVCRSQLIQYYFGEHSDIPCGICDCCLQKQKQSRAFQDEEIFKNKLLETLALHGELAEEDVFAFLNKPASDQYLIWLRQLVDQGKIVASQLGKYSLPIHE
ncbi:MAG: hypothetical protein RL407_633 [Bacteroidota bacterium]